MYTSFTDHDFTLSATEQNIVDNRPQADRLTPTGRRGSSFAPSLEQAMQDGNFYVDPNSFDARQINIGGTIGVTQPAIASLRFGPGLPLRKPLIPAPKTTARNSNNHANIDDATGDETLHNSLPNDNDDLPCHADNSNRPIVEVDELDHELNTVVEEAGTMDNQF